MTEPETTGRAAQDRRVLVTGASVAGNALAWWLDRRGFDVTVVERAPAFRDGGQNVDVRGLGREVMRRMGLELAALARGTGEEGTAFVDAAGIPFATFEAGDGESDGPTAEMEILRGDLARLIQEAVGSRVEHRFGDSVAAIAQGDAGADVTFASGRVERYAMVVVAEGVGSATRQIVFPGENQPRWMDMTMAYFTIPRGASDTSTWRWFHATGGRSVSLRPDRYGTIRASLMLQQRPGADHFGDVSHQKALLRARFADAGWETARVLASLDDTPDFYFDVLRQVRMPRWSKGRVALAGDAAWCVTPLGGRGTTLAIVGAYVLAGELARADPTVAFAAYERIMRPMVARSQSIPKLVPRLFHPRSRVGVRLLRVILNGVSRPTVRRVIDRLAGGGANEEALPEYGPVTVAP